MTCPECGAEVSIGDEYCSECGSEVPVRGVRLKKALLFGVAVGVLLLALVFSGSLPQVGGGEEAPVAPGFTARDVLTGDEHSLSDYRGEWVFVDFSTSWCSVCQRMAPILERYYQGSKPEDVVFLTISNEGGPQGTSVEEFKKFAKENDAGWPHLIDRDSSIYVDYGVKGLPTFVLVGPEGKIRARSSGYMNYGEVEKFVEGAKAKDSVLPFGL